MSPHDWDTSWLGPAVYSAPSTRCLDCLEPLSIEAQAARDDLCDGCAEDEEPIGDTRTTCCRCMADLPIDRFDPPVSGRYTGHEGYCLSCEPSEVTT